MDYENLSNAEIERAIQFRIASAKDDEKKIAKKFNKREAFLGENWRDSYDNVFI